MESYNQLRNKAYSIIQERKCGVDGLAIQIDTSYSTLRKWLHNIPIKESNRHKIEEYITQH